VKRFRTWCWDAGWLIFCIGMLGYGAWELAHGRCITRCTYPTP
jgi:hypothetical protein